MRTLAGMMTLLCLAACALAQRPDVAVVKATFTIKKQPASARGVNLYCGIVEKGLRENGVPYDLLTEEQVAEGKLAGYKLAIFPFNSVYQDDEMAQVRKFVESGGKLMWFSSVPPALQKILGIGKVESRGKNYEGEFHTMKFAVDRPAGFPAEVYQESPNSRIVQEVLDGSRAIAIWRDKSGKDLGIPAVILSPDSVWVSHVFWTTANTSQQHQLLLATIGHFMPSKWSEIVEGVLGKIAPAAGYDSLDAVVDAAKGNERATEWAKKTTDQAKQARDLLAARKFGEALALAKEAQCSAQVAAAAMFPSRPYELRGAWVHPNDATDWEEIMSELEAANFNAVFPIMCGPGSASYPSAYAPQVTQKDLMKACIEAARRHGIEVHVWKANWQILGAGAEMRKKCIDEGRMVLSVEQAMGEKEKSHYQWSTRWLDPSEDRNRELEFQMMMELVEKYHPDGIHFDFMRYPASSYCYCERCRKKFEEWAGLKVEKWPQDCWEKGKHLAKFRDWRRYLQTSLVKRIAEGARRIDPNIKLSLAARASMTGSFESDAQDWVTWSKEGYLDMLCPMDYTPSVDVLRDKLEPQAAAIDGVVPIYAGLGVSPARSATPVNLSQQIKLARELGADGFLMFALSPFSRAMLPALKLGATSTPVTVMPHHKQPAKASFAYPDGIEGAPKRTYAAGRKLTVPVEIRAAVPDAQGLSAQAFLRPAAGGEAKPATDVLSGQGASQSIRVDLPPDAGIYCIVLRGEVVLKDGSKKAYYLRSQPLTLLSH